MDCKVPQRRTVRERLQAIEDGWQDLEYWTPCEVAPLILTELVERIGAPHGSYYLEVTAKGKALLKQGDAEL